MAIVQMAAVRRRCRRPRRRRGCWRRRAWRCGLAARLVTESARVVEWLPFLSWRVPPPHLAAVVAYYAALGVWLWARVPGTGERAGAAAAGGAVRDAGAGGVDCGRAGEPGGLAPADARRHHARRRPGRRDRAPLPGRRDDAGRRRRALVGELRHRRAGRRPGPAGARHPPARLPGRDPRRCRSHRRRRQRGGGVQAGARSGPACRWPGTPPPRRCAAAADGGRRPPGARCSAATGSRSARSRSACCTRRRPTGSASASATTTRWCWR